MAVSTANSKVEPYGIENVLKALVLKSRRLAGVAWLLAPSSSAIACGQVSLCPLSVAAFDRGARVGFVEVDFTAPDCGREMTASRGCEVLAGYS